MVRRLLQLAPALLVGALSVLAGCASAPMFRAQAVVEVTGKGERAWENAREAASALTLRQNLRRLERDVRGRRLKMLDGDDPIAILQEVIVAKRTAKSKVRVRLYGDFRRELRILCNSLLNLWESEGLIGKTPTAPVAQLEDEPSPARTAAEDVQRARTRAEIEEEERRLFGEKQKLLSEQVELGRGWQDAETRVGVINGESSAARKAMATQEVELRKVQSILRKPPKERFEALGDQDVLRLHADVRDAQVALKNAVSLPAEIRARVAEVLSRKKKALEVAQSRFETEAQARVTEAKERLTAVEQKLDAATRGQSDIRGKRYALEARLKQIEGETAGVQQKLKDLRAEAAPVRRKARKPRRIVSGEARIYRVREVLTPCRVYRLRD